MTQDEIIELARQAGLGFLYEPHWMCQDEVQEFANLVAQHEREACANFIEHDYVRQFERPWRDDLSAAIRARGQA